MKFTRFLKVKKERRVNAFQLCLHPAHSSISDSCKRYARQIYEFFKHEQKKYAEIQKKSLEVFQNVQIQYKYREYLWCTERSVYESVG